MIGPGRWTMYAAALWCVPILGLNGQTPDTTKPYTLPPTTVSVTRTEVQLTKVPLSIHSIDRAQISRARPTWGLDEALANVPGVYVANRYNFSRDQDPRRRHSADPARRPGPAHEPRARRGRPHRSAAWIGVGAVRQRVRRRDQHLDHTARRGPYKGRGPLRCGPLRRASGGRAVLE